MASRKDATYFLRESVEIVGGAFGQSTIQTNLALADRYGMRIRAINFEFGELAKELQELILTCDSQIAMKTILDEQTLWKAKLGWVILTSGAAAQDLIIRTVFTPGLVVAQKELFLGMDSDGDQDRSGYISIEYELVKLTNAKLIALATR